ncbi:hypothetical protein [Tsukamurella tyrosinosolvens]|uniref:hypothetical protein n=1 Tax=Tsukamurella tyrosinosolvens TaxID=57704 RepID=UPI002DD43660|nr:hypothetical protein [Tsukamurella tyrosinosolvens]MEC4616280.1 hypothetical protein [Tsukamurella tyrosinosolvens]
MSKKVETKNAVILAKAETARMEHLIEGHWRPEVERLRAERDRALAAVARVEARVARLREDYASELAATDPDTNWALGVKHAVQLVARELRREAS